MSITSLIEHSLCTGTDSINWEKAFTVFETLDRTEANDKLIMETIGKTALDGNLQIRINSLQMIDGILKNCKGAVIKRLITHPVILGFANDIFTKDPAFHRALCGFSKEWVGIAEKNKCCSKQFLDWQKQICSYRYNYVMTPEVARKFIREFTACYELLQMFAQCLTAAVQGNQQNDAMLNEILPNIHEMHLRLKDLKPTIADKHTREIISYLIDFAQSCKTAYHDYTTIGSCDVEYLNTLIQKGIPKNGHKHSQQPQMPPPQPQMPPQQPQIPPPQPQMPPPQPQMPPQPNKYQQSSFFDDSIDDSDENFTKFLYEISKEE